MDAHSSRDLLKDLVVQQNDSDVETDEELTEKCHQLFTDTVKQSELRCSHQSCVDESDFTADSEHSFGIDLTDEASGLDQVGVQQLPEQTDIELFSEPAEWRRVWEWEVGECNRTVAEQNTQQYDEVEVCSDGSESLDDDVVGSYCGDDAKERPFLLCMPYGTLTLVGDSHDLANAVSSSVVVNEPISCTRSSDNELAGADAVYDREITDNDAIQSVLDDVVSSCMDKEVTWDSDDESGLTELDRQRDGIHDTQFSRDFTSNSSEGRVLSMCIPAGGSSHEHQDHASAEGGHVDSGLISGLAASSLFAQRPSLYSPGAHTRSGDSKWNPPRTPPTTDNDGCRWRTRKSWRNNSTDGLDSAGCSPKDDEDDDSDDETSQNSGAAALKQNKISPASGYHAGSSYYYPMGKEKSWLARCDDRQHMSIPSENNSSCLEPSEDSYYSQYQRRRSGDDSSAGRGFGANSDEMRQRMMRRKQARRERESAGLTTADSVAGYRGRDCSIEELIEYIDAKPPAVPKAGQRQSGNRKNRKKKRDSNLRKSVNGDVKRTTAVDSSDKPSDLNSGETSPEKLSGQTVDTADAATGTSNEPETHISSGDDKVHPESVSELPLRCDTFFQMLPSDGSSSNVSDGDNNVLDFRTDDSFRNNAASSEAYSGMSGMLSVEAVSDGCCVGDNSAVTLDPERKAVIAVPATQITEGAYHNSVEEFGIMILDSCCSKPADSTTVANEHYYDESKIFKDDSIVPEDEIMASDNENSSPPVSSSCVVVPEEAVVNSVNDRHVLHHRSEELSCESVQPGELTGNTQKIYCTETGQSTPCSSISDARDSLDFDSQSLADDLSSDFDFSAQTFNENDFTVVTQKKKKKPARQNVGSSDCLRRTFYNRNHRESVGVRDWQSSCRNVSVVKQSSTMPSTGPVICSSGCNNAEVCSAPASQQTTTSLEVPATSEFVQSLVCDRQMGSDTDNVLYVDRSTGLNEATSAAAHFENTSPCFTSSTSISLHSTSQNVKNVKQSSADRKTQEKVFLDTRQPSVGVAPAIASSELSFWYDMNVPENRSVQVQTDSVTLLPTYNVGEPSVNTESAHLAIVGRLHVDSCAENAVSLHSSAADSPSLLGNNSSWLQHRDGQTATPVDCSSQMHQQQLFSRADVSTGYVTLTSGSSSSISSSQYIVSNNNHSESLVVRPAVCNAAIRSSSAVVTASVAASSWHSSSRSRQLFALRDAQLFLYDEFQRVLSAECRNRDDVVYFADPDSKRS